MSNNSHKKRRRWIVATVVLVVLVGGGFGISAALRPSRQIDSSKLATVERGDLARSVVATGKIEPLAKVEVKSKASGIVEKIFADYGDRVKQGQILVELDKEQLRARVAEARANLQAAEASVQSAQATFERNVVDALGPDVPFLKSTAERIGERLEIIKIDVAEGKRFFFRKPLLNLHLNRYIAGQTCQRARIKEETLQNLQALHHEAEGICQAAYLIRAVDIQIVFEFSLGNMFCGLFQFLKRSGDIVSN